VIVLRYGLAIASVAIALSISVITHLHNSPPRFVSHFVLLAIAVTFWCAGTGPGLLALVLSSLGVTFLATNHFLLPDFPLVQFLIFFVAFSALMGLFSASRRRAQKLLVEARNTLQLQVAQRTEELLRSNQELRASQKRFESLLQTAPDAMVIVNASGQIVLVNSQTEKLFGYSASELLNKPVEILLPGRFREKHSDHRRVFLGNPKVRPMGAGLELYALCKDGSEMPVEISLSPLETEEGTLVSGAIRDITERKRAEQLQADLAHTNRVTMLGELAASISHELKQPITATMTNARVSMRWLKHEHPDLDEVFQAAQRIEKDGARATEIIDRLRALYKKTPPKRALLDVNEIIGEMVVMLRDEASRFAVSIRTDLAADLPKITADRVQLQQVLMNLMLNGIEAMNETRGVLTMGSKLDNGYVLISVSDTGVGLPPGRADKIFDAFFTTKPQGSGMGLAISRSIVESHGGRLWATPNDGRGTTFHFSLLAAAQPAEKANSQEQEIPPISG